MDSRVTWLKDNAIKMASVSPSDANFADLQPLKAAIGNARIVMLGEQSHGDGTTFLAKTRLVRFLHEEMGFDVLAFESGFFDVHRSWRLLHGGEDPISALERSLFSVWTYSAQVEPLLEYVGQQARGPRPLEVAGFDLQFTGSASRDYLVLELEEYLRGTGSATVASADWEPFTATLGALIRGEHNTVKPPPSEQARFLDVVARLRAETGAAAGADAAFWHQALESTRARGEAVWARDPANVTVDDVNRRDVQMARNLEWLAEKAHPNRKIIVWAATYHVVRDIEAIDRRQPGLTFAGVVTMGDEVHGRLGSQVFSLGFTAYEGRYGQVGATATTLPAPTAGSLEALMGQAGLENAIVTWRTVPAGGEWLRQPLLARPLGYAEYLADWTKHLDGMVFTRTMTPSTTG